MASQKKLIEDEKQREDQIKRDREMAERMSYDMTKKFLPCFCVPEPQKETATNGNSTSGNNTCSDCRGITRIHRLPSRPSHPYGRQPHSLIFMSTLYKATSSLPASS